MHACMHAICIYTYVYIQLYKLTDEHHYIPNKIYYQSLHLPIEDFFDHNRNIDYFQAWLSQQPDRRGTFET
jgi:hypothetical protein